MKRALHGIGFCAFLLPMTFAANAHEYWPLVDGAIYEFTGPDGGGTARVAVDGDYYVMGFRSEQGDFAGLALTDDAEGRLLLHFWEDCVAGSGHPYYSLIVTPHTFLDTSLAPGQVWVSIASTHYSYSTLIGHVVSECELDLPAGSFTALEIQILTEMLPLFPGGHFYLAPGVGVVKFGNYELSSLQIPVVTESTTWGEVKTLFRDALR
jgi:hypothetical protein